MKKTVLLFTLLFLFSSLVFGARTSYKSGGYKVTSESKNYKVETKFDKNGHKTGSRSTTDKITTHRDGNGKVTKQTVNFKHK
jgi:hypothetical protein